MRWKCSCTYDGTNYCGWQSQLNKNTIQDIIESKISEILCKKIRIHGSSRTDAGVHAKKQIFHFYADWKHSPQCLLKALNVYLPAEIRILDIENVSDNFHARFSVKNKTYYYYFQFVKPTPFEYRYVWHIQSKIFDLNKMIDAANVFYGTHDFRCFSCKNYGNNKTIKQIFSINILTTKINQNYCKYALCISGNGFLYKMIRMIVGTLIMCASGKIDKNFIINRLNCCENHDKLQIICAPAHGLFLEEIQY